MPITEPLIQQYMTVQPQSIESSEKLQKARDLMTRFGIRHLPVTCGGKVIGILSERDINLTYGLEAIEKTQYLVMDVCREEPYAVGPEEPLRLVVQEMANMRYGSVIVMKDEKLAGIFTTVDACRALNQIIEDNMNFPGFKIAKRA